MIPPLGKPLDVSRAEEAEWRMRAEKALRIKHDAEEPMLKAFAYEHLPDHLKLVSAPFATLAYLVVDRLERMPERSVCLRKLLEAKDCAVRAVAVFGSNK
jgi:hypothetical protein